MTDHTVPEAMPELERMRVERERWKQSWRDCQRVCGDYQDRAEAAEGKLAKIRALHRRAGPNGYCGQCGQLVPCATIRALGGDPCA